ncbi:N-acetyltransferase [Catenulispora sp. NF23]|uniref:N-acetyltransferase n=1 Tax=Catenulispora pinistramenti TaxID=2705254 RepID=A0ABS5L5V1_9ACTN|nr:N-acetyltransferase [Catenulispora pinistramenti]MBS2553689.1 N-acetyltransferase [Catenulispora pinistramenti]
MPGGANGGVTVVENKERGRYEARVNGALAGVLAYSVQDGVAVMPHTMVEPQFEGRGLGALMAETALDDARARGLKVAPRCWFVAAFIEKNPEYQDLVAL